MLIKELQAKNLLKTQISSFITDNTHYLVMMGSVAYGCAEDYSDMDVYGWVIPPKHYIFPHLAGFIPGFGKKPPNFEAWQEHHIFDKEKQRSYDISLYGIIKYFNLVLENNPNMIDSLFVPLNCVLHSTESANLLRENRHLFLHKGSWHKFKGYAFSQFHKCKTRETEKELQDVLAFEKEHGLEHSHSFSYNLDILSGSGADALFQQYQVLTQTVEKNKRRAEITKRYGYDVKFAYHTVRLVSEAEEILTEHTLTLDRKDRREMLKSIRRGEWSLEEIQKWFKNKEIELNKVYQNSTLRHSPDEDKVKQLLLDVLESHFGSLSEAVIISSDTALRNALQDISDTVEKYRKLVK